MYYRDDTNENAQQYELDYLRECDELGLNNDNYLDDEPESQNNIPESLYNEYKDDGRLLVRYLYNNNIKLNADELNKVCELVKTEFNSYKQGVLYDFILISFDRVLFMLEEVANDVNEKSKTAFYKLQNYIYCEIFNYIKNGSGVKKPASN